MRVETLRVHGLRCLKDVAWEPARGLNLIVGANGAGKTSLIEALYVLSHGHSFRPGGARALVGRGGEGFEGFGVMRRGEQTVRLGLGYTAAQWAIRIDGETRTRLADLLQACAVICFEPGSQGLVVGPAEDRRSFLDWGMFHVEHAFLPTWRKYRRALRQRNALLRSGVGLGDPQFSAWEREMAETAEWLDDARARYLQGLSPWVARCSAEFLAELGPPELAYRRGWEDDAPLAEVLQDRRASDRERGFTTAGPHRADWKLGYRTASARDYLSRGQQKLASLCCCLGQAAWHAEHDGDWPILCLDDFASELDAEHQASVLAWLADRDVQVFLTGTSVPDVMATYAPRMFHVKQGTLHGD